jgi:hypothetical protein
MNKFFEFHALLRFRNGGVAEDSSGASWQLLRSWPVLRPIWHALWVDGTFVRRVLWGVAGFVITLGSLVFAEGVEVAFTWTTRQWAAKVVTATIAMGLTMINPTGKKAGEVAGAPSA